MAYEPGDYGSGDAYGTITGPLLRNADGSYSIGDQEIYPDLKITVEEDLSLTISGSPINTETYHSDDFVAYNAESPYQSYQLVFNRDTTPPPPENYKTMLNTTIPLPKERGEEVSVDGMPSYYVEPQMDAHISFVNYYSTAVLQVQRQKGNVELKDAEEMARNATPQSMSGTPYFDGNYLYIDVTEVSETTDDFKNSDLKEIIFGVDDEGNLVLLRDDIGELKAGTVFWK